jgi:hypothetical protein
MPRDPNGPSQASPGGYQPGPDRPTPQPPKPQPVETFKQQVFYIKCTGMKPKTVHKFYYEGVDRGVDCKPIKPKPAGGAQLGSELKTDDEGTIIFNFYFTLDVEAKVDASNKVKYEPAGDKKFKLVATDSSAAKIVPMSVHYVSPPPPTPRPPSVPDRPEGGGPRGGGNSSP